MVCATRGWLIAVALVSLTCLSGTAHAQKQDKAGAADADQAAQDDDTQPEVKVEAADADKLAEIIKANHGKVILVDYWATWCVPCVEKFPSIVKMHEAYAKDGLLVISVSVDQPDNGEQVLKFLQDKQAGMTNLRSSLDMSAAFEAFELTAVPEYRVYGRDGKLQATFKVDPTAEKQYDVADIEAKVKELLQEEDKDGQPRRD